MSFLKTKSVNIVMIVFLIFLPIVLWILPGDFFDHGTVDLCPSKAFFDIECFGCGITRAVQHFHNFQFADALYFNKLVVIVYPWLIFIWYKWMRKALGYAGYMNRVA